jgi:hypothetical protein
LGRETGVGCGIGYEEIGGIKTDELPADVSVVKKELKTQLSPGDLFPEGLDAVATNVRERSARSR